MANKEKLDKLLDWLKDNEIVWDKEELEIRIVDNAFGVFALKDLASEEKPLVKIPKSAILSVQTTGIANILEDEKIAGSCSLAIAIMYELSQGEESPWYGYLQALPMSEDLPVFWNEEEKSWFKGTEMQDAVHNDLKDLDDDYKMIVAPLLEEYPYIFKEGDFSFDLFCRISTLISSRAFEVDAFHQTAMVPFADIFNHRSGDEHVHFVTDFDVCEDCGELEYCEHRYLQYLEQGSEAGSDDEEGEWSDMEDDTMEDDVSLKSEEEEDEEEEGPLEDLEELEAAKVDFWKKDEEEEKKDTCDMILERDVKAGQEIFNTYGQHPNIVLLSKYGFCLDNNENDYVSVDQDLVFGACIEIVKNEVLGKKDAKDQDAAIEQAIEYLQERFEYFLTNEDILCPREDDDEEEEHGGCNDGCCGDDHDYEHGDEHDHEHGDEHGDEHGHDHEHGDGCCDGHGDDEEEEEEDHHEKSRPYYANVEGLYQDALMCLLHIVFVNERTFEKFKADLGETLTYFENLAEDSQANDKKSRKNTERLRSKKLVYTVCKLLSEHRRKDYLDENDKWTPIEEDIEKRSKVKNHHHYLALTCRISEKKIIEKSLAYYDSRIKSCDTESEPKLRKKRKN